MPSLECPACGEMFRGNIDRFGARCPNCRRPLYEPPETHRSRFKRRPEGECAHHPDNQAVGPCKRCGALLCTICKTKWFDQVLCVECLNRVMSTEQSRPEDVKNHRRSAMYSIILGGSGWLLVVLGSLPFLLSQSSQAALWSGALVLTGLIPALIACGLATAAIRTRGDRMIPATCGLVISGLQIGLMLGMLIINIWHS